MSTLITSSPKQPFVIPKAYTKSYTVTGTDTGTAFTNQGATGSITFTLPSTQLPTNYTAQNQKSKGYVYHFLCATAQNVVIQPLAGDAIRGSAAGVATTLTTVGQLLCLQCVTPGYWEITNGTMSGTLTAPVVINSTAGQVSLTVNGASGQAAFQIQATASNAAYGSYSIGGTVEGYLGFAGVANSLVTGSAAGDLVIRTQGGAIDFSANSGTSIQVAISSGVALTVNKVAGSSGLVINGTSGDTGLVVYNGSSSSNFNSIFASSGGTTNLLLIYGDGGLVAGAATGGDKGLGTINVSGGFYVNGVAVGGASTNYLLATATQTKNSTTMGNSTFLTYAIPATGTYQVECLLIFYNSSSTPGVDFNLNYSGTFTANSSPVTVANNSSFGASNIASAVSTILSGNSTVQTTAANPSAFFVKATLVATGTGTLAVAFSQNSASAGSPTTLGIGSYMNVTKVA